MKIKSFCITLLLATTLIGCSQTEVVNNETSKQVKEQEDSLDPAKLLPIGTVVKLSNVEKTILIYGYDQIQVSTNTQYDYIGVPYPEGNISPDYNVFFNRNLIEEVLHNG